MIWLGILVEYPRASLWRVITVLDEIYYRKMIGEVVDGRVYYIPL